MGWTKLNRLPDYTALIKIADFFQCSIDYLVGRQDNFETDHYFPEISQSEQSLIKNYRKLDSENKELVSKLIKNLLK